MKFNPTQYDSLTAILELLREDRIVASDLPEFVGKALKMEKIAEVDFLASRLPDATAIAKHLDRILALRDDPFALGFAGLEPELRERLAATILDSVLHSLEQSGGYSVGRNPEGDEQVFGLIRLEVAARLDLADALRAVGEKKRIADVAAVVETATRYSANPAVPETGEKPT